LNKLILDKKFKPLPVDDDDELFPNGIFVFNITKLLTFIKAHQGSFSIEDVEL